MKYNPNTIAQYMDKTWNKMKEYEELFKANPSEKYYAVSISQGNKKIGRVMNVSLSPVYTCVNCSECLHFCYDIKANIQYKNVLNARTKNTVLAVKHHEFYFNAIRAALMKRHSNKYFRWHVGGDIPNYGYFTNMVQIAKDFPDFTFWTYTKNYGIVNLFVQKYGKDAIPSNLTIMFSEWDGMKLVNPHNFPVFTCKLANGNKNHEPEYFTNLYKCPGNCDICKALKRGCIVGETTYADEH